MLQGVRATNVYYFICLLKREVDNLSVKDAQQRMARDFRENASRPLFSGITVNLSRNFEPKNMLTTFVANRA